MAIFSLAWLINSARCAQGRAPLFICWRAEGRRGAAGSGLQGYHSA